MNEKIGCIFDADGVLVDSVYRTHKAIAFVCRQIGVTPPTYEEMLCTLGAPYDEYWHSIGVTASKEQVSKWYHEAAEHSSCELYPDVLGVIRHLGNHCGIHLGVVTANHHENIDAVFKKGGITKELIPYRACHQQNKVIAIKKFCRLYALEPSNVFFVGDLRSDMRDGRIAKVRCIGITRGGGHAHVLRKAGAERCIEHLDELFPVLGIRD